MRKALVSPRAPYKMYPVLFKNIEHAVAWCRVGLYDSPLAIFKFKVLWYEGVVVGEKELPLCANLAVGYAIILTFYTPYTPTVSCLLYTSPSPRDRQKSRMPSSA